jgi:hypothetical protein
MGAREIAWWLTKSQRERFSGRTDGALPPDVAMLHAKGLVHIWPIEPKNWPKRGGGWQWAPSPAGRAALQEVKNSNGKA